jgi:phage terminase large subunit-like protein
VQAGRGFGKTRLGAEWILEQVREGKAKRIALIAPTAADTRDVMVEGESGILSVARDGERPLYEPSKRRLTWPNGAVATTYSADEPERLRGPQHDCLWGDEPASWRRPETWDMAMFGLRLGDDPRALVTGTPKPVRLIRELRALETTVVTRGRTLDNAANLAPQFLDSIVAKYQGTRLGQQELEGELLDDTPGALWQWGMFATPEFRLEHAPPLKRLVVGVDPAASSHEDSDETGIVAAGLGADGRGYVLADASLRGTPNEWARTVAGLYSSLRADKVIAERNNGGEMVASVMRTVAPNMPVETVWASRGKRTRAEPIAALYEQNKVSHVGLFTELETQLTSWMPGESSPDRLDALVWALSELMLEPVIEDTSSPSLSFRGSRHSGRRT